MAAKQFVCLNCVFHGGRLYKAGETLSLDTTKDKAVIEGLGGTIKAKPGPKAKPKKKED